MSRPSLREPQDPFNLSIKIIRENSQVLENESHNQEIWNDHRIWKVESPKNNSSEFQPLYAKYFRQNVLLYLQLVQEVLTKIQKSIEKKVQDLRESSNSWPDFLEELFQNYKEKISRIVLNLTKDTSVISYMSKTEIESTISDLGDRILVWIADYFNRQTEFQRLNNLESSRETSWQSFDKGVPTEEQSHRNDQFELIPASSVNKIPASAPHLGKRCKSKSKTVLHTATGRRDKRKHHPVVTNVLTSWLNDHIEHPYPSHTEKQFLLQKTGLNPSQLDNWFINHRIRHLKPKPN